MTKNDSPSPVHYKEKDMGWKKMSNHTNRDFSYSISKAQRKGFIDMETKTKNFVPGSGKYKDDMSSYCKLSFGNTIPHYKRGR